MKLSISRSWPAFLLDLLPWLDQKGLPYTIDVHLDGVFVSCGATVRGFTDHEILVVSPGGSHYEIDVEDIDSIVINM